MSAGRVKIGLVAVLVSVTALSLAGVASAGITGLDLGFTLEELVSRWWVFPASVVFSMIALAAGVSGALFFTPFFMLVVGLSPAQAIGAGLVTEVFGMGNGLREYVKQRVVDYRTAKWLLLASLPLVVVGALVAHLVDPGLLKIVFGGGLVVLGGFLFFYPSPEECSPGELEGDLLERKNRGGEVTVIESADGETYRYLTCWRLPGAVLSGVGAFVTGLISAGLPEIVTTQLIVRCRLPPRVAVATSVFVLGVTAVAGAVVHALSATPVWSVVVWSVPGVVVGGSIGTRLGRYLPGDVMEDLLGVVFVLVGLLVLGIEFLAA